MKRLAIGVVLLAIAAVPASASTTLTFHFMQIEQVIGGVDGDATAQAIQLRMRSSFQNLVQGSRIRVWDATGANPIIVASPGVSVPNHGAGVRVLIASANFVSATSPNAVPDFTMSDSIPVAYLAAGSLTFENSSGTIVYWRLSWGGGGYTGATTGATTNDADGQFGPPFAGALPSTGTTALQFTGEATDQSTSNSADYSVTAGDAVFTNNAGVSFTVESTASSVGSPAIAGMLSQNTPNPFNPSTEIAFSIPAPERVSLRVFDAAGRLVATLFDGLAPEGTSRVAWNGRDEQGRAVGSGVYFYRLSTPRGEESRKMVLLK